MRTIAHGLRDFHAQQLHKDLQKHIENAAPVAPPAPSTNRGPTSLHISDRETQKVQIDWLSFTSPVDYPTLVTWESSFLKCLFPSLVIQHNDHGIKGYPDSDSLFLDGVQIGMVGHGAKHGRNMVTLTGKGCGVIQNYAFLHECLVAVDSRISRIDHSLDFYRGEMTYDECKAAYQAGEFQLPKSPVASQFGEIVSSRDGVNLGRTMYVGSRTASKMARCYEKGLEIFARMSDDFREANTDPSSLVWGESEGAPNGTIADQWFRVEIESKNTRHDLPLDMVLKRDEYFAGAYPFCARVLGLADGVRPAALKPVLDIELAKVIQSARNSYGNLVFSLTQLGYSADEIVELLSTGKHNERLVRAGLLGRVKPAPDVLVSHPDDYVPF